MNLGNSEQRRNSLRNWPASATHPYLRSRWKRARHLRRSPRNCTNSEQTPWTPARWSSYPLRTRSSSRCQPKRTSLNHYTRPCHFTCLLRNRSRFQCPSSRYRICKRSLPTHLSMESLLNPQAKQQIRLLTSRSTQRPKFSTCPFNSSSNHLRFLSNSNSSMQSSYRHPGSHHSSKLCTSSNKPSSNQWDNK